MIRTKEGALRQYDTVYNRYVDAFAGGGMYGWDWSTMRLNDPDAYYTLRGLLHLAAILPSRKR